MGTRHTPRAGHHRLLGAGLALIGAAVALSACDEDIVNGPCCSASAEADFSLQADATGRTQFRLEAINGNVRVIGALNTETVVIEGTRRVEAGSQADADEGLELLQVEVNETDDEVVVRTEQPSNTGDRNFVVDYQITVPLRLLAVINNANGNVAVEETEGGVQVANANGNVTLIDIVGDAEVDLVNGNIEAQVTPSTFGAINLINVNGNVILAVPEDVSAELEATLTNGSITVSNLTVENQTSTSTRVAGTLGAGAGEIELRTVNGNIEITGF